MKIALWASLIALGGWFGLRWLGRRMLYHPSREFTVIPNSFGLPHEEVRLPTEDGVSVHGWFVPAAAGSPVLLLCHGNAGNISHRMLKAKIFHDLGLSVLLFDYRGYGKSDGSPSEEGTYRDAEAALRHLLSEGHYGMKDVLIYGESLGGGVALELALRRPPRALILESAFTSVSDMAKLVLPRFPARPFLRDRYENLSKIGGLGCPVLILHSPQDDVVPFEMGRRLFAAAPEPKRFFELKGDHNEGFLESGEAYPKALSSFLGSLRPGRG